MRLTRALFLALALLLFSGCVAMQQNINLDMQNIAEEPEQDDDILCLIKPADGPIFSGYGVRRRIRGGPPRIHAGIDIAAPRGSDVVAAAGGTVVFSGRKGGYGNTVKICHGNDLITLYAHMDRVFVTKGQTLDQGERLGLVGRTGRTTGPHLHFELRVAGQHTNPVPEGGWTLPELTILAAADPAEAVSPAARAIAPSVATAAAGSAKTAKADAPPANPILAFFRKHARPAEDEPRQPAS